MNSSIIPISLWVCWIAALFVLAWRLRSDYWSTLVRNAAIAQAATLVALLALAGFTLVVGL